MYEGYTRQALPSKEYRELLGTAICVFNSNTQFIIENILKENSISFNWYKLIDYSAGQLKQSIENTISKSDNGVILELFENLVNRRNRIVHSFQITSKGNEQILATKEKIKDGNDQFIISKDYLMSFIKDNEELSALLHEYRGC